MSISVWSRMDMAPGRLNDQLLCNSKIDRGEPLLISSSSDIKGSILQDTLVRENCSLDVGGNLLGNLTIEAGATVVVEGSVDRKIVNRGGRLVVNNNTFDGPPETEACGILKINLTAIASNYEKLNKHTQVECASLSREMLTAPHRTNREDLIRSRLPEAKRVHTIASNATIYVLHRLYPGTGPLFTELNAAARHKQLG